MKNNSSQKTEKNFYITSPIFYPNGELHIGHAYVITICDMFARYHRLAGDPVYFLTGADENSTKIIKKAEESGKAVPQFLDEMSASFKELFKNVDASYDQFIRTKDEAKHWPGAIALWNKLVEKGDIYKRSYKGLYCVGCESFWTEKDLLDGKCPYHHVVPELIEEENYFFRLSSYTAKIKSAIESGEMNILPQTRKNEIVSVLNDGLEDVSFSRPTKHDLQGIPVPGDPSQTIYVWCDALASYITALGYGGADDALFGKFWPASLHLIGKDILRFHAAIWPGMLLSAGLPLPRNILVHGLIMSGGRKMSKSLGNVIDPKVLLDEYGTDAVRYYFSRHIPLFDDGEMTPDMFKDVYNANLANGIGNLTSRIIKMAVSNDVLYDAAIPSEAKLSSDTLYLEWKRGFEIFHINGAADAVWKKIGEMDRHIQETEPFKLIKTDPEKAKAIMAKLVEDLAMVAYLLRPILPETSLQISQCITARAMPVAPLFLRK